MDVSEGETIWAIKTDRQVIFQNGKTDPLLSPALGAVLMSASTVIVAINARLLKIPQTIKR